MRKFTSLLTLLLVTSVSLFSCSDDETPKETLTVKGTFADVEYEKEFTVNADEVYTDTEGFTFELSWTSQEGNDFDVDFFADAQAKGGDFETGFDLYSTRAVQMPELVTVKNTDEDTYGKTNINLYSAFNDTVDYDLQIIRISNGEVIKTISGSIQSTEDDVDNVSLIDSRHPSRSHGYEIIGDFVKVGNKFYFSY